MAIASRERAIAPPRAQFPAGRSGAGAVSGRPAPRADHGGRRPRPRSECPRHRDRWGLRMTILARGPSSTIALAGGPVNSRVTDGSDFLPYPEQGWIDHNEVVSVGLGGRLRTMADAAQIKGASRLRIQHSPQSEEERGVRSAPRSRLYWVGRKGFEGLMQLTRGSEGVPPRRGREQSSVYWIQALTATASVPRSPVDPARCRPLLATPAAR